jgi:hypothetical protein
MSREDEQEASRWKVKKRAEYPQGEKEKNLLTKTRRNEE